MARLNNRPSTVASSRFTPDTPQPGNQSDQENHEPGAEVVSKGKARVMPPRSRSELPTPPSGHFNDASRIQKRKRDGVRATQYEDSDEERFNKYYDPNQDLETRRQLKRKSRALERDFLDNRDVLLRNGGDGLKKTVERANAIYKNVKQTGDATLDSRLLVNVSDLAYKKTAQLVLGDTSTGVDVDEFLSKCITYMRNSGPANGQHEDAPTSSRRRRTRAHEDHDDHDDLVHDALDWEFLGRTVCFPHNSRPPVPSFLLGPLSVEKKQRTLTQRKARQSKDTAGREARPEALTKEDLSQSDQNGLTAICTRIRNQLHKHCRKAEQTLAMAGFSSKEELRSDRGATMLKKCRITTTGGPSLFDYVVNPRSFGQTVENLFYVSFLIKEGTFGIVHDDQGLPTIISAAPHTLEQQREKKISKHQAVFALDYGTWQSLVEAFEIQEPMIPHRQEDSNTQVGERGWYMYGIFSPKSDAKACSIVTKLLESGLESGAARARATHFTTASSQKKRKLAPFAPAAVEALPDAPYASLFEQSRLAANPRSSPSSSPQPPSFSNTSDSNSQAPSPASSHPRNTPPRVWPAHLQEEVLQSREFVGQPGSNRGVSPSGAFAEITIDCESKVDMSGSDHDGSRDEQRTVNSPSRTLGARSASPAKRSAADMEGAGNHEIPEGPKALPGSFATATDDGPSDFDHAMSGMTPGLSNGTATQHASNSTSTVSTQDVTLADSPATSFGSDTQSSASTTATSRSVDHTNYSVEEIDEQVRKVTLALKEPLDVGRKGIVVSMTWLARVLSRSSEHLKTGNFTKETREGPIGAIDNGDIVPEGAFAGPLLHDMGGEDFISLRPGLAIGSDFEIIPASIWGDVVGAYGIAPGQKQISRYAKDTAPAEAPYPNIMYEVYPPTITIRKVTQPNQPMNRPPSPPSRSVDEVRKQTERRARGQSSPEDAIHFVSSRAERFQQFLARSKEAAGIPRTTKVKLWRLLAPQNIAVDKPDNHGNGVPSPPQSRCPSPIAAEGTINVQLVFPAADFKKMEVGKDIEHIDAPDETNNDKYNGKSTNDVFGLFQDQTILLEEQIGGPAGGEFASDQKKNFKSLGNKRIGTRPGSTTASGRTSPAPGAMMTRGRARRDGRTRGTIGLANLGNTCYMNSALQCIRSVEELAIYFLSEKYKHEINANNPLGHGGAMAKQYAGVLTGIYGDSSSSAYSPQAFKRTLGSIQPLFSGYQQQDSQEFLSFLVDALHEDLNRILKKPYNENPDSDDNTVHDPQAIIELGETYRANHKARNDSVAMDLFNGFYKNTMECPNCDKISITFDPFSLVTVQLPIESTFQHVITFVPLHGRPINHALDIDKNGTVKTLKETIASKHTGVSADRLWMVEVYNHKPYKFLGDHISIAEASIQTNDYLFIFELESTPTNIPEPAKKNRLFSLSNYSRSNEDEVPEMDSTKADRIAVPIFSRQKTRVGNGWEMVMHPLYITVTREEAMEYDTILKKVLIAVSQITSRSILTEFDEGSASDDMSPVNGESEKEDLAGEEVARVSDGSVPSEDGYVKVSVERTETVTDAEGTHGAKQDRRRVPAKFMDPEYFLSPALRNQLFALNYARSGEGMLCTGLSSIQESSVRNMLDRVSDPVRRSSVDSSTSGDSVASTGASQANGETDESDVDDNGLLKPAGGFGGEDSLSLPGSEDEAEDETLPDHPLETMTRAGRRGPGKPNKYQRRNKKHFRGKDRNRNRQGARPHSSASLSSTQAQRFVTHKAQESDDNQYYIKLGECIVLDWTPEAMDALFGGDESVGDELRGSFLSHPEGKGLELFPDPVLDAKRQRRADRKKHGITLEDCFVETGKREILSEDNAWYCSRCKEMRQAAKTLEIWTIPDILIVHLKRFGGNRSFRDKIDVMVDYPIEGLDMTQKVGLKEDGKQYLYDLFAVDNHYGGLGGGHYTALAKNFYDGQWYDYNDSSCSKVSDAKIHSAAAYLLFYRRRSEQPLGPEYLQELVNEAHHPSESPIGVEESEAGEGKLGGPTSSLHGSPSASTGAGVAVESLHSSNHASGVGIGSGSNPTAKTMTSPSDEGSLGHLDGKPIIGPPRPPMHKYGNQGSTSWGFHAIDSPADNADQSAETLLGSVVGDDSDNMSTAADHDSAYGDGGYGSRYEEMADVDWDNASEDYHPGYGRPPAGRSSPIGGSVYDHEHYDNHDLYSHARGADLDALQLEEAGTMGGYAEDDDPPTVAIHLGDGADEEMFGKMD